MSVEFESAARLAAMKSGIEAKTGEAYADLTEGVQALVDGFGQGGGLPSLVTAMESGSLTLASDGKIEIKHSLGKKPDFGIVYSPDMASGLYSTTYHTVIINVFARGEHAINYDGEINQAGANMGYLRSNVGGRNHSASSTIPGDDESVMFGVGCGGATYYWVLGVYADEMV